MEKHNEYTLAQLKVFLKNSVALYNSGTSDKSLELSKLNVKIPVYTRRGSVKKSDNQMEENIGFLLKRPLLVKLLYNKYFYEVYFSKNDSNQLYIVSDNLLDG